MKFVILILVLNICFVFSNKSSCGCSISRQQGGNKNNVFLSYYNKDTQQCQLNDYLINIHGFKAPEMILVPGGRYQFGTDDVVTESDKEGPKRIVTLKSFYLDKYEVSNEDFGKFISATGYRSEAEVFGDSFVFSIFLNDSFRGELVDFRVVQAPWWYKVKGASWKHPHGPDSDIANVMDHPVVHVSWGDARAYCRWRGARLPNEEEWEAACRGGDQDILYPWGDKLYPNKTHMANIWQGSFPNYNSKKDGFIGTCSVDHFQQNSLGFHNLAGNVWEWTEDTWSQAKPEEKVKKGGSYLCHRTYCFRYRCSARSQNTQDSTAGNLGFRCAKTP